MRQYPCPAGVLAALLADPALDVHGRDMFGLAAVHKLAAWGDAAALALLLAHGDAGAVNGAGSGSYSRGAVVNMRDAAGATPLHHAVAMGAAATAAALAGDAAVDRGLRDGHGRTPHALAVALGSLPAALTAALQAPVLPNGPTDT